MNVVQTDNRRTDTRDVRLLLMDMLRRWWWVYGIIAFYMMFTTFAALPLGNQDASLTALMYSTAVLSSLAIHLNLHKGYIKVVTALPFCPKDITTALWVSGVLFPVAAVLLGALLALPLQNHLTWLLDEPSLEIRLIDLALVFLVSVSLIGSACLITETTAVISRRVLSAPMGWRHELWAYKPGWVVLPPLAVIAATLHRAQLNWSMVGWRQAIALTAGLVMTGVSFRYRHLLITAAQTFRSFRPREKAVQTTPIRFGSRLWPRIRVNIAAALVVIAGCAVLYLPVAAMSIFPLRSKMLYLDVVSFDEDTIRHLMLAFVAIITAVASLYLNPPRVLRALPLSPARIAWRIAGFHLAVFTAFFAGIAPLAVWTHTVGFLYLVPLALGVSLAGTAAIIGLRWTAPRWVLLCTLTWLAAVVVMFLELSPLDLAIAGCILSTLGISGLYLALARSGNPYRIDPATREVLPWR
jgi:hypothetical protein